MLIYKVNVLEQLRLNGYYPTRMRKERLLSESTIQKLRRGEGISWSSLESICCMLKCQPGDIIEYHQEAE